MAQAYVSRARELARKANAVLLPNSDLEAYTKPVLTAALVALNEDVVLMRQLRAELAQLRDRPPDLELLS